MKECPKCGYRGCMIDLDGYLLECPKCHETFNEDG